MLSKITAIGSGVKTFVSYAATGVTILTTVKDLVKTFEEDDPDNDEKNGEKKKEAVLETVEVLYDEGEGLVDLPIGKEKVMSLASKMIDITVNLYNAIGVFR